MSGVFPRISLIKGSRAYIPINEIKTRKAVKHQTWIQMAKNHAQANDGSLQSAVSTRW